MFYFLLEHATLFSQHSLKTILHFLCSCTGQNVHLSMVNCKAGFSDKVFADEDSNCVPELEALVAKFTRKHARNW